MADQILLAQIAQLDRKYQVQHVRQALQQLGILAQVLGLGGEIAEDDAVRMATFVIGAKGEYFKDMTPVMERAFFTDCVDFIANHLGGKNIISAVVHKDETSPHIHADLFCLSIISSLYSTSVHFAYKTKLSVV